MNTLDPESPAGWLRARQRKFTTLHIPIQGFGPTGEHTLYLPSARTELVWEIRDGRGNRVAKPSCLDEPGIREKRDALLRAMSSPAPGVAAIADAGSPLIQYAIALIHLAYHAPGSDAAPLGDEDLTLLLSGQKWYEPVLRHAMGGDDVVKQLVAAGRTPPSGSLNIITSGTAAPAVHGAPGAAAPVARRRFPRIASWFGMKGR